MGNDILLNFTPIGRTGRDKTIIVPFSQPLNFRDAIVQIVNGTAELISHSVTGHAYIDVVYSTSGKDEGPSEEESASSSRRRIARTTISTARAVTGNWDPDLTLSDRLRVMNAALNKPYMGAGVSSRSKLANWPATICIDTTGLVR